LSRKETLLEDGHVLDPERGKQPLLLHAKCHSQAGKERSKGGVDTKGNEKGGSRRGLDPAAAQNNILRTPELEVTLVLDDKLQPGRL
jgi:hypothetical protein